MTFRSDSKPTLPKMLLLIENWGGGGVTLAQGVRQFGSRKDGGSTTHPGACQSIQQLLRS